ncbi:hypothetical protein B0H17DRAFT_1132005 [Mycena rosella]|uniref:Uncharacterized protein n=1 Tax=Mycena rosella TaxID=1033263 RepID=A0AAD7GM80_MYCRO|nr:hypothetical protein B0H17DRAFT_1132005 [Mycena rosella]
MDFPEAGAIVCLTKTFQEGDPLLSHGEVFHNDCSTVDLLPLYLVDRDPLAADDPTTEMDAMHPRHALLPSRRSARFRGLASAEAQCNATPHLTPISSQPTKKWLDSHGQLMRPEGGWSTTLSAHIPASRASHSKLSKGCKTKCGYWPPVQKIECAFARGNVLTTSTFSMLSDVSVSITSYSQPRARVLHPYISKFYLVYYEIKEDISLERSTFFVDRNGQIFMFRSFRAQWLMDHAEEVEVTHDILRQSSKWPHLTSWHLKHQARVDAFMAQQIFKRIINWISDVVEIVFPGIAHQFKQDAKWHEERYGINPLFGLFWNLCFNAWFHNQRSIHCGPHADKKNQVGICLLLIYILKCGTNVACHLGGWSRCAPESNDAPEPPDVNALLPTVFNLLHQLGVNPSGLLSAEVIKLQKQISLNVTSHVAEPVAEAINGNQPRQMSLTKPCEILWSSENLEPRRIHNGRRKEERDVNSWAMILEGRRAEGKSAETKQTDTAT